MAYDEGVAEMMREDLADLADHITEKKMFGGLAFMLHGHMLCGVHSKAAMYRVGKHRQDKALSLEGVVPMAFTGKPMGGMVEVADDAMADDTIRATLLHLAKVNVAALPPK